MQDSLLTALMFVILLVLFLWKSVRKEGLFSFDKGYTNVLKGLSAIVVVFVHVAEPHHNAFSKMVMSFGFVAVSLFFMISAYGMQFSVNRDEKKYLSHFWRNRLASLLIPCILINLCAALFGLYRGINGKEFLLAITNIPGFVVVLLQYCLLFFIVMFLHWKLKLKSSICYALLILGVTVSSLCLYFMSHSEISAQMGWCYERIGLIWGLLLFLFLPYVANFISKRRVAKMALLGMSSLLLGVAYIMNKTVFFYGEYLLKIILGLSIILFLFAVTQKRNYGNAAITHLGNISYEIYLSHGLVMRIVGLYFQNLSSAAFLWLSITLILIFSTVIHLLSSKLVALARNS